VILGGVYAMLCPDHARRKTGADHIIPETGIEAVRGVIDVLRKHGHIAEPASEPPRGNAYPAFDLLERSEYIPILTSTGCPYRCSYCASRFLYPRMERRDPMDVLHEILFWHQRYGIRDYAFYDDALLMGSESHAGVFLEEIARRFGAPFKRTKVGEINVADEMRRRGARIGGEGNGGVISPEVHLGRDSLAGIVYILEMMAETGKSVSELVADLPRFFMIKGKTKTGKKPLDESFANMLKKRYKGERISDIDGIRIDFKHHAEFRGGWVHLRPSNTEPIFRIIAEGVDERQARKIYGHFEKIIKLTP